MSKEKQKGTSWESAIVGYLSQVFSDVGRLPLKGGADEGDIRLFPWTCIEAKNQQRMALSEWVDEANREGEQRNSWLNVVWHKRPRKASPGHAYVTMDGETFKQLLVVLDVVYQDAAMLEKLVKLLSEDVNE